MLHPVEERRLPLLRDEDRAPGAHRVDCRLRQRLGVDVPLIGEIGLDYRAGTVAVRHAVGVWLDLVQQSQRLQPLDDLFARDEAIEAVQHQRLLERSRHRYAIKKCGVVREIEPPFDVEHVDERQIVTAPDLEIVEIVRRRDLHRAGALLRIGILVGDDRNAAADEWQDRGPADEMPQALVLRMDGDSGVTQHRLRPRRRDHDEFVAALERIFDVPEAAPHLDLLHFEIGDRSLELGVPIDEALVLVDEAVAIKRDEHLHHRARKAFVHGEALARPVAGGAEPLELADDGAARFRLPLPHALDEGLAAHFAAARLLALHQLAFDHGLRGNAGVVGAGLPQHVLAAHALETAEDVLQGVVERMTHVQRAGHVGRRDDDAVGRRLGAFGPAGAEGACCFPCGVDAALDRRGLVGLVDRHCCASAGIAG